MTKELSDSHKKAMQEGRAKAMREKRKAAVKRVEAYQKWLKAGSVLKNMPTVPSDADYRLYRGSR